MISTGRADRYRDTLRMARNVATQEYLRTLLRAVDATVASQRRAARTADTRRRRTTVRRRRTPVRPTGE
jgi:hypothetical protein